MNYNVSLSSNAACEESSPSTRQTLREKLNDLLKMESEVQSLLDRIEVFLNGTDITWSDDSPEPKCFDNAVMMSLEAIYSIKNRLGEVVEHLGA